MKTSNCCDNKVVLGRCVECKENCVESNRDCVHCSDESTDNSDYCNICCLLAEEIYKHIEELSFEINTDGIEDNDFDRWEKVISLKDIKKFININFKI